MLQQYFRQGQCVNNYWAKDPDLLNNLLEALHRFRENRFAITGDIKKMYHTIRITGLDQKTHKFLWRECKVSIPPDILVTTSASFRDRPAGNIATVLYVKLQKWVEKYH